MYNMFDKGSANNSIIDPRMESIQPDPNQVSVIPVNPVVAEDKKLKRQNAMLAALKGLSQQPDTTSNPWAAGMQGLGTVATAGMERYLGDK